MNKEIGDFIKDYVREYMKRDDIEAIWQEPLVGFADAGSSYVQDMKHLISDKHQLPQDVMAGAATIIAYYVPFTRELADTNNQAEYASPEWARTYEETNAMFGQLNSALAAYLESRGYKADVSPEATTFDKEALISNWSQRHMAYAAGLGTFGINNMLISSKGCCGRYSTLITNIPFQPEWAGEPAEERCGFLRDGSCGVCAMKCPAGAILIEDGKATYDRNKCYILCQENAKAYSDFGSSYDDGSGSEVCGKCVTGAPCAFI